MDKVTQSNSKASGACIAHEKSNELSWSRFTPAALSVDEEESPPREITAAARKAASLRRGDERAGAIMSKARGTFDNRPVV
jgi:hypothetical protein